MLEHLPKKRRQVLKGLLAGALAFLAAPFVHLADQYLTASTRDPNANAKLSPSDLAATGSVLIEIAEEPVIVVRQGEIYRAFNASCTHLGCIVSYDASATGFVCKCHQGRFDRDGVNVPGSKPKRPLTELRVSQTHSEITVTLNPKHA